MCQRFTCLISFTFVFLFSVPASGQYWRGWPLSIVADWNFESPANSERCSVFGVPGGCGRFGPTLEHIPIHPDGSHGLQWVGGLGSSDPVIADVADGFSNLPLDQMTGKMSLGARYEDGIWFAGEYDASMTIDMPSFQREMPSKKIRIETQFLLPSHRSPHEIIDDDALVGGFDRSRGVVQQTVFPFGDEGFDLEVRGESSHVETELSLVSEDADFSRWRQVDHWVLRPNPGSPSGITDFSDVWDPDYVSERIFLWFDEDVGLDRLTIDSWAIDDVSSHAWTVQGAREAARSHAGLEGVLTIPEPPTGLMFAVIICVALLFGIFFNRRED